MEVLASSSIFMDRTGYLQRIAAVSLSIDHIEDLLLHYFSSSIARSPIIPCPNTLLSNEEVFGVVNILVCACLDSVDDLAHTLLAGGPSLARTLLRAHPGFQIKQYGSGYVSCIVAL